MEHLFLDTHLWLAFSFIIFVIVAFRMGKESVLSGLDGKIESIRNEIKTAEDLRIEAQELLAQYQRKQRDAMNESQQIIENAREHAEKIREQAKKELKDSMARREEQLKERLARIEEAAMQDIQAHAANLATQATMEMIARSIDAAKHKELLDESIKNVATQVA